MRIIVAAALLALSVPAYAAGQGALVARLVIATTDGRTGMSGLKSGQRVERSS